MSKMVNINSNKPLLVKKLKIVRSSDYPIFFFLNSFIHSKIIIYFHSSRVDVNHMFHQLMVKLFIKELQIVF